VEEIARVIASGPFQAFWQSLKQYTVPQWYEDANYAIALHWPGEQLAIRSLGTALPLWDGAVHNVHLLGHAGQLEWSHGESGLTVRMPDRKPCDHAFVLKIS
jgi:hypothetical protein